MSNDYNQQVINAFHQFYYLLSIQAGDTKRIFQEQGIPFRDEAHSVHYSRGVLRNAASQITERTAKKAAIRGSFGSLLGPYTSAIEHILFLLQTIRLAQRIALIYGEDFTTEQGKIKLSKAISKAYGIEIPKNMKWNTSTSDVLTVLGKGQQAILYLILQQLKKQQRKQLKKMIPGIGLVFGAKDNYHEIIRLGKRLSIYYSKSIIEDFYESEIIEATLVNLR